MASICWSRRFFRKKQFFLIILFVGLVFLIYQIFSVNQLDREIAKQRSGFRTNFREYEKADDIFELVEPAARLAAKQKLHEEFNRIKREDDEILDKANKALAGKLVGKTELRVLGVLKNHQELYTPTSAKTFRCILGSVEIPFERVNDDYCDCDDGSDEPSTNACPNGRFYCTFQNPTLPNPNFIPSSRVNDGVCDCCDGSDEWKNVLLPIHTRLSEQIQIQQNVDQTPCRNRCQTNI